MLKFKSTYEVKVAMPEGTFICVFKRRKQNQAFQMGNDLEKLHKQRDESEDADEKLALLKQMVGLMGDDLVEIKGGEDEEGAFTVERFKAHDLYEDIASAIITARFKHGKKEDKEKKS
jgi:hypothetical protein